jgi:uncharacterized NAD(P)/FAD-binding protein YdhS
LVNCTGPGTFAFSDDQTLAQNLRRRGLARPGHLDAGTGTDAGGRVLTVSGEPIEWMWALGSQRQAQLLESTAVPEIRSQALQVASAVRQWLAGKALCPTSPAVAMAG